MAEEKTDNEFEIKSTKLDIRPANRYGVIINESDVSLIFGSYLNINNVTSTELHTNIVMPFGQFLAFAEFVSKRVQVLNILFEGQKLNLSQIDEDRTKRAWATLSDTVPSEGPEESKQ